MIRALLVLSAVVGATIASGPSGSGSELNCNDNMVGACQQECGACADADSSDVCPAWCSVCQFYDSLGCFSAQAIADVIEQERQKTVSCLQGACPAVYTDCTSGDVEVSPCAAEFDAAFGAEGEVIPAGKSSEFGDLFACFSAFCDGSGSGFGSGPSGDGGSESSGRVTITVRVPFDVDLATLSTEWTKALKDGVVNGAASTGAFAPEDVAEVKLSQDQNRRVRRADNAPIKAEIVLKPNSVDPTAAETAMAAAISSGSFKVRAEINGETISATITDLPLVESKTKKITTAGATTEGTNERGFSSANIRVRHEAGLFATFVTVAIVFFTTIFLGACCQGR